MAAKRHGSGSSGYAFGRTIETVALEGEAAEPVPVPGGTVYGRIVDYTPSIEDDGIVVFQATTGLLRGEALYLCAPRRAGRPRPRLRSPGGKRIPAEMCSAA
jgi:hypothetical protein